MKSAAAAMVRQVLIPNGLLVLAAIALSYCGFAFAPSTAYLVAFTTSAISALLAWRFYSPRLLLALLLVTVVDTIFLVTPSASIAAGSLISGVACLVAVLLPLNLAVLFLVDAPSFDLEAFGWWAGLIAFQVVTATAMYRADAASVLSWLAVPIIPWFPQAIGMPQIPLLLFAVVGLGLLIKLLLCRTAVDSGLFWCTCTCFLALITSEPRFRTLYFAVAGLILGVAVIETSYQVAYHDELTGLPGRRAFNRAVAALGDEYAIAMVDIDHFKRFNDTFGHDVGDQVLRMVASKLAKVGGDGTAFRCGGEEFAIVFPLGTQEAFSHAETLRQVIEQTPFVVRGPDRSHRRRKERRRSRPTLTKFAMFLPQWRPTSTGLGPKPGRCHLFQIHGFRREANPTPARGIPRHPQWRWAAL